MHPLRSGFHMPVETGLQFLDALLEKRILRQRSCTREFGFAAARARRADLQGTRFLPRCRAADHARAVWSLLLRHIKLEKPAAPHNGPEQDLRAFDEMFVCGIQAFDMRLLKTILAPASCGWRVDLRDSAISALVRPY